MVTFSRALLTLAGVILTLAAAGCSSTKLTESWVAPDLNEPPASKILLVAMIKDPVTRRFFEEHFVAKAREKGVVVIPSHELAPNPTDHDQKEEVKRILAESGAEGVLLALIKGIDRDKKPIPSRLDWYPDAYLNTGLYNYYYKSYRAVYRPGYIGEDRYFNMQMRYFSTRSEKMVWAGNTRTKNPRTIIGTIGQITDEVIDDLKGSGLL